MLLTALSIALVVLVVVAGRLFARGSVRVLTNRFGPIPWWMLFVFIATLIIWKVSRVDSTTYGLLVLADLILFIMCVLWIIWPRHGS